MQAHPFVRSAGDISTALEHEEANSEDRFLSQVFVLSIITCQGSCFRVKSLKSNNDNYFY